MRYALSENELLLEIRDLTAPNKIRRLCQTLNKQIDVALSEVMLLVDFISIKLAKLERGSSWSGLGFDIANFAVPERGQMKSNFLKSVAPKPDIPETPVMAIPPPEETIAKEPEEE